MSFETESRTIVERVLTEQLGEHAGLQWLPPSGGRTVHVRIPGRGARGAELLVSTGRLELELDRPARTVDLEDDYTDTSLLERDVARLGRLVHAYLRGQGRLERTAGPLGVRRSLVVRTTDGEWRIGPRRTEVPDALRAG